MAVVLRVLAVWWGPLNQDEGWYLYAARRVAEGARPYADFAFTQGPVFARVYAWADPLVRRFGLAGGRAVTAVLGFGALAAAAGLASTLAGGGRRGRVAAMAVLALCGWNVQQAVFMTGVKTYALAALFLTGGLWAWVAAVRGARGRGAWAACAGLLLALAVGVRFSAIAVFPPVLAWWWRDRRRWPATAWAALPAAAVLTGLAVTLPAVWAAPGGVWFGLVEYHAGRAWPGLAGAVVHRLGFASRLVRAYLPVLLVAGFFCRGRAGGASRAASGAGWLWGAVGLVTLLHLAAPFPYDDYQVFLHPLAAALAAAALAAWAVPSDARTAPGADAERADAADDTGLAGGGVGTARPRRALVAVGLLCLLHAAGSPWLQEATVAGRDRIWWRFRDRSALAALRDTARWIDDAFPGTTLLTQDLYLAVETGRAVPPGLELGPFSIFPDLSEARAARLGVLTPARFRALLEAAEAPVAAFSGYGLAVASPAVTPLPSEEEAALREALHARYRVVRVVEGFGQAGTALEIFARREPAAEGQAP